MNINAAKFTYLISEREVPSFANHYSCEGLSMVINYTKETELITAKKDTKEIAIIGLCIDSHAIIDRNCIPKTLLSIEGSAIDIYNYCNRFAGKYIVFYCDGVDSFLWGDATASIQMNYCEDAKYPICIASTDKLIADYLKLQVSESSKRIRMGASLKQALPWNITMYDEIKALLPNHILSISNRRTTRVPLNIISLKNEDDLICVAEQSQEIILNIVKEYSKYYEIICPLTSGYDSRVVFSFLKKEKANTQCYTLKHKKFTEETGDLFVPKNICNHYEQPYTVIPDIEAPRDEIDRVKALAGDFHEKSTVDMAYTYNSVFKGLALVNGDIIDQIGKSHIGNAIPNCLASPSYFQCKLHNNATGVKQMLKKQIKEMHNSNDRKYVFDLFAMENRCGRWAVQGATIYSICGITSLNIFNCRELIRKWISIPRKYRSLYWLHKKLLLLNDKELLSFPFNPTDKFRFAYKNWFLFYIFTYIKQVGFVVKKRLMHR